MAKSNDKGKFDIINNPEHYCYGKYECIDLMEMSFGLKAVEDFCKLNTFKYLFRYEHKNGIEDLNKACFYINKLKELVKKETT